MSNGVIITVTVPAAQPGHPGHPVTKPPSAPHHLPFTGADVELLFAFGAALVLIGTSLAKRPHRKKGI